MELLYIVFLGRIRSLVLAGTLGDTTTRGFGLLDPGSKVYSGWQLHRLPVPETEGGIQGIVLALYSCTEGTISVPDWCKLVYLEKITTRLDELVLTHVTCVE